VSPGHAPPQAFLEHWPVEDRVRVMSPQEAKVAQHARAPLEEDVLRLDIAMDHGDIRTRQVDKGREQLYGIAELFDHGRAGADPQALKADVDRAGLRLQPEPKRQIKHFLHSDPRGCGAKSGSVGSSFMLSPPLVLAPGGLLQGQWPPAHERRASSGYSDCNPK